MADDMEKEGVPVTGTGLIALGAYLLLFTMAMALGIWAVIPPCDVPAPLNATPPAVTRESPNNSSPLQITAITPATGIATGSEPVTIVGSGFSPSTKVRFGGAPATQVEVDGTKLITAITPPHNPGAVSVMVSDSGLTFPIDGRFSYVCPAPSEKRMILIVLMAGALGGLVHTLRSFYWYAGSQLLLLNWVPMYVLAPFSSSALGFVFYLVIRAGLLQQTQGTSFLLVGVAALVGMFHEQAVAKLKDIAEGIFTKVSPGANSVPPPRTGAASKITIAPAVGPIAGGTPVKITGTGFTAQSTVTFGAVAATNIAFVNATELTMVTPAAAAAAAGPVDVKVKTGGNEAVKPNGFTYQ